MANGFQITPNVLDIEVTTLNKIDLDPENPAHYLQLGDVYYTRGKLELALKTFQKAKDLDPDDPEVYFVLGLLLKKMGRPESDKHFKKAIKLAGGISNVETK